MLTYSNLNKISNHHIFNSFFHRPIKSINCPRFILSISSDLGGQMFFDGTATSFFDIISRVRYIFRSESLKMLVYAFVLYIFLTHLLKRLMYSMFISKYYDLLKLWRSSSDMWSEITCFSGVFSGCLKMKNNYGSIWRIIIDLVCSSALFRLSAFS